MTVGAGGEHYDNAALAYGGLCRSHTLEGLIYVLVERIAAVGRNGDICIDGLNSAESREELASCLVRRLDVTCNGIDRLLFLVDNYVDDVCELRSTRRVEHILVKRVALKHAGSRIGARDELGAVVSHYGLAGANAGEHALSAA